MEGTEENSAPSNFDNYGAQHLHLPAAARAVHSVCSCLTNVLKIRLEITSSYQNLSGHPVNVAAILRPQRPASVVPRPGLRGATMTLSGWLCEAPSPRSSSFVKRELRPD